MKHLDRLAARPSRREPSTFVKATVCLIAAIGFAFGIYELLMLPLILRPALQELIGAAPGTAEFEYCRGMLFFLPAMAGGIFGLLGGYLTDLLGRRSVLTFSILLYAFSALASGFVTSVEWLVFFRCTTFIGVCVEFVAAVAWLSTLMPQGSTALAAGAVALFVYGLGSVLSFFLPEPPAELEAIGD